MTQSYPFQKSPLPYEYQSLAPYIDAKTMELHDNKHLQNYINQLNLLLSPYPFLQTWTLEQLIFYGDHLPQEIATGVKNNGGGVYNHEFYFNGLIGDGTRAPMGKLKEKIDTQFGSFKEFQALFSKQALGVFGSGYLWLVKEPEGSLSILSTSNQETPLTQNLCPVLAIDVWEHAYYLKHYNMRGDYISDWFQVVNWEKAEENYTACTPFFVTEIAMPKG